MNFLNGSLLAGGLLAAIPIVIHLAMRRKPRLVVFPAMRFVKTRQESNARSLNLRHWLLLALRCLVVALAVGVLARPSVAAAAFGTWLIAGLTLALAGLAAIAAATAWARGLHLVWTIGFAVVALTLAIVAAGMVLSSPATSPLLGDQEAPVAAVILAETAPHAEYRHENRSRIDVAREAAGQILAALPAESEVAIADSRPLAFQFQLDRAAALQATDRWRVGGAIKSLASRLSDACEFLARSEKQRREAYVLTDFSKAAWDEPSCKALAKTLEAHADIAVYVVDVGAPAPTNVALGPIRMRQQTIAAGAAATLETTLSEVRSPGERIVECLVEIPDPTLPVVRDGQLILPKSQTRQRETATLVAGETKPLSFRLLGLPPGTHHGVVRLVGDDPLSADNTRHFTIEVAEPKSILIVAPKGVDGDAFWEMLAPMEFRQTNEARFVCRVVDQEQWRDADVESYAAACFLDPFPLTAADWNRLAEYAAVGRGLALFLGPNAGAGDGFKSREAIDILGFRVGGAVQTPVRTGGRSFLLPRSFEHPILGEMKERATMVRWDAYPVHYHWGIDQRRQEATTVVPLSDGKPLAIETPHGRGRIVTFLTPGVEPLEPFGRPCWNELYAAEDMWPWFVIVNETIKHVATDGDGRVNYMAGEIATLPNGSDAFPERYQLFVPGDVPQEIAADREQIVVRFTQTPGTYRLRGVKNKPVSRGFSVATPADATEVERIAVDELKSRLGKDRVQFAANPADVRRVVGEQRVGRELGPILTIFLAIVAAAEHLLANRFYVERSTGSVVR